MVDDLQYRVAAVIVEDIRKKFWRYTNGAPEWLAEDIWLCNDCALNAPHHRSLLPELNHGMIVIALLSHAIPEKCAGRCGRKFQEIMGELAIG